MVQLCRDRAMTMEEVVAGLIVDQHGWFLYPEPIPSDVQSLTHTAKLSPHCTVSQMRVTKGDSKADNRAFHGSHPVLCPPRSSDLKTEGFLHMGLACPAYSPRPPARAIRPYGAQPRSLLIIDSRKRANARGPAELIQPQVANTQIPTAGKRQSSTTKPTWN